MIANPNITAQQQVKPADGETLLWAVDQRDPRTLGPGLLNDGRNLRFADGVPGTRQGVVKPAWANYTTVGSAVIGSFGAPYGAGVFRDPNGVEWQMIAAGGQVWRTRPGNGAVTVPTPTGVVIVGPCRFVQAFNLLFLFRGRYLAPLVLSDLDSGFADLLPQYGAGGSLPGGAWQAAVVATGTAAEEMAYGPYLSVSGLTWAGGVATCVTVLPHGYITGSDVTVAGASPRQFNGRAAITVVDDYTFTYALRNNSVATATGVITCSNNAFYWTALGGVANVTALTRAIYGTITLTSLTSQAAFTLTSLACPASGTVASLTRTGTAATATTATAHGLSTGETATIAGSAYNYFNGAFVITVTGPSTFTYTMKGTPAGNDSSNAISYTAPYCAFATAVKANHGLTSGATVTISGATDANAADYNITAVVTVVNSSTFTYALAANPGENATGTITCTPADSTTATATAPGHGLTTGATVTIAGASPSEYDGTHVVTVVSASVFTYAFAGSSTGTATGTITATSYGGTTALATAAAHGYATGDYVTLTGASPAQYNGTFAISVLDANTFSYTLPADPGSDATGVITAQGSRVAAGQTPDTNPDAWTRQYDILPNAETALFTQNLLLVPTAFQPSSSDNYATIDGGEYSTVDFLVATNYLDYLHFEFNNEFRINQGTADEIVDLFAFGQGNVVVLKGKSYWFITGLASGSIANVSAQCQSTEFGAAGPRAWAVVGSNAYFLSPTYGVAVIRTTDLGTVLSVNVPLTAPLQPTIDRVDWTQGRAMRMGHWDNKLYVALILKDGSHVIAVYDFKASVRMGNNVWESGVMTQGWAGLDTGPALAVLEFFRLTLLGRERHFFLDTDGYVNLLEEGDPAGGDQIAGLGPQGLAWTPTDTYGLSRSYGTSVNGQVRPVEVCVSLATLNPTYSLGLVFAGANKRTAIQTNRTRSKVTYDRPWTAPPWDATNVNDDWATPYRQDYSVSLATSDLAAALTPAALADYTTALRVGAEYTLTVNCDAGIGVSAEIQWATSPALAVVYGPLLPLTLAPGVPLTFSAPRVGAPAGFVPVLLVSTGDPAATGTLTATLGTTLGSGLALDRRQECLDTRRLSGRQDKSYQVELENTTGAITLVGLRIGEVPGRNRRGILT